MRANILSRIVIIFVVGIAFGLWRHENLQRYYREGRETFVTAQGHRWDRFYAHPHHLITGLVVSVIFVAVGFGIYELLVAVLRWLLRTAFADKLEKT